MRSTSLFSFVLVLALLAAACSREGATPQIASLEPESASTSEDAGTADADPVTDTEAAMLAFTQCLRDQGIEIDDPTIDADGNVQLPPINLTFESEGEDPEEAMAGFEAIMAPCEKHLEGITTTVGGEDTTDVEDSSGGGRDPRFRSASLGRRKRGGDGSR